MRIAGMRIVVCRDLFVGGCVRLCPLGAGHQIAFAPIMKLGDWLLSESSHEKTEEKPLKGKLWRRGAWFDW